MMRDLSEKRAKRLNSILRELGEGLSTAEHIARLCKVSTRTVYRDIEILREQGHSIAGEAGAGYLLRQPEVNHAD